MSQRTLVREIQPHVELHKDRITGIAWVEDGRSGIGHSAHPNIDASGSVAGMKKLGYWRENDRTIRSHGFIYNIDRIAVTDDMDRVALNHCTCRGCRERRERQQMH